MILAWIESHDSGVSALSLETLTLAGKIARDSGQPLEAVLIAAEAAPFIEQLSSYSVSKFHHIQHEQLDSYAPDAWASSLEYLIESAQPDALVGTGSDRGNEVMARLAARLNLPMAANCVEVTTGDSYRLTRTRWGGTLLEEATLSGNPKLMTTAPHMIPLETASSKSDPTIEVINPTIDENDLRVRVTEHIQAKEGLSLATARVVVGGGRGVGSTDGFSILEDLAEALGGVVGASRVATNEGWRPHSDQIGQTGTRIAPEIYIACGVSGATQHMVGCAGAKNILVINTDSEAPILSKANYAIIGDLHEVVPAMTEAIVREHK
jgi:electron transfer flavoprotein alpha subunit